jgi:hypothetical protein
VSWEPIRIKLSVDFGLFSIQSGGNSCLQRVSPSES